MLGHRSPQILLFPFLFLLNFPFPELIVDFFVVQKFRPGPFLGPNGWNFPEWPPPPYFWFSSRHAFPRMDVSDARSCLQRKLFFSLQFLECSRRPYFHLSFFAFFSNGPLFLWAPCSSDLIVHPYFFFFWSRGYYPTLNQICEISRLLGPLPPVPSRGAPQSSLPLFMHFVTCAGNCNPLSWSLRSHI